MATKRTILYFTIDPEVRKRYKAVAALKGKTLRDWVLDAMHEKLERDLQDGGDLQSTLRLAEALHSRIATGTKGKVDAAKDIAAMRKERGKALGS